MKKRNQRWRLIYLFPLAVLIYIGKQLRETKLLSALSGALILVIILLLVFVPKQASSTTSETVAVPSASPVVTASTPSPTPTPQPVSITLSFAGDCTFGKDESFDYSGSFNETYDREGADYFLKNVRDIFSGDDLTVVNFEGTLTDSTDRADKSWAFKGPREYVNILTGSSVEAANIANNHTADYGEQGLSDTKDALTQAGIRYFGYEDTTIIDVKGIKVGFTGQFTVYEDERHFTELQENIKALKDAGAQVIIANFHWGLELHNVPDTDQVELAHTAIDAGAHLVIGHHPHVLQGIEEYNGRYILYSLGNFCFGGNGNPPDYDCIIFQQTFTVAGDTVETINGGSIIPCLISSSTAYNDYCPTPAEGSTQERIMEKLESFSSELEGQSYFR